MKNWKKNALLPVIIVLPLLISGCGGQAYQTQSASPTTSTSSTNNNTGNSTTTTTTTTTSNLYPPVPVGFTLVGTRGTSPAPTGSSKQITGISTDRTLRITFKADDLTPITSCNNGSCGYQTYNGCVGLRASIDGGNSYQTVTINTAYQDEDKLAANGGTGSCTDGAGNTISANPVANFTGSMTSGHGAITLLIYNATSTTKGPTSYYGYAVGPMQLLYYTWQIAVSAYIHTDTTN